MGSLERINSARELLGGENPDYALSAYVAGLAVEMILQANALHAGAAHDAKHTLVKWLGKCPSTLHGSLRGSGEWNLVVAVWDKGLRYLSFEGLLGYLRRKGHAMGKKGGVQSIVRASVKQLIEAAEIVHAKGLAQWLSSTRK